MAGSGEPGGDLLLGYADGPLARRIRARLGRGDAPAGSRTTAAAPPPSRPDNSPPVGRSAPPGASRPPLRGDALAARLRPLPGEGSRDGFDDAALDWERVVDEHRRAPIPDHVGAELVARGDCPREAALALVVPGTPDAVPRHPRALEVGLRRGIVTPRQVIMEATPGWSALRAVAYFARSPTGRRIAAIDRLLDEAAALLPGDDPDAWARLICRAPDHPGTFPHLCAEASAPGHDRTPARGGAARPAGQRWVGLSPLGLLGRTDAAVAAHVIATLPDDTLRECLRVHEVLPGHVVFPLLRRLPALTSELVHRLALDPPSAGTLLARHAPRVNAALLSALPDSATRHAVFAATRRDAPSRVRLHGDDRSWLRVRLPDDCAEAVYGHHPDLALTALTRASRLLGTAGVLRGLLGIWETRGRMAVYDPRVTGRIGADHPAVRYVRSLTRDPRGLARLRTEVDRHERPAALIAAMRADPALTRRHPPRPDDFWPEAVAAHDREPLPAATLAGLTTHPDCPDLLTLAACRTDAEAAPRLAHLSPAHARAALTHPLAVTPFPAGGRPRALTDVPWYADALADRLLSFPEFVEHAHPAHRVLEAVESLAPLAPDARHEARRVIAAHITRDLADNPDAWAVALRLAPDFPGTLPQLTATAAAVFH
ncbi:hypothetical protein LO772_02700 [Yinghuangia sp. ASG 101]|uniref:hypothetical protein n=1 Tax=Yinghuangia sp. ASG 101 TaxID=2896848 RepID=UPI001E52AD4D|nr:hypothetical protein [Yinghuangia sp. ASG 101]UGQ12542.1 hypothetical protein LO772_02700 [Yinghuangia sp. ASG 101]